jgi:chromosome segregation ATPase
MLELVDFTEVERLMLLEKEAGLQEELRQAVQRAEAAEEQLAGSREEVQQLGQQLGECKEQVGGGGHQ